MNLFMATRLIKSLGGKFVFKSEPKKGSMFRFCIPLEKPTNKKSDIK